MNQLTLLSIKFPLTVIFLWLIFLTLGGYYSINLNEVIRGSTDSLPNSPSDEAMRTLIRGFGSDSVFILPVIVENNLVPVSESQFKNKVNEFERALTESGSAKKVQHFWNSKSNKLIGADDRSALMLVTLPVSSFYESELYIDKVRNDLHSVADMSDFSAKVTGPVAVFHDMNQYSANDLLAAEKIGIPIALFVLLIVFGAPLAAMLPLLLATTAVTISLALLYALSFWMPVSVFARNTVTMIGLGVGINYALFLLVRYRKELINKEALSTCLLRATKHTGRIVLFSGITTAAGFLALFLVDIPLMNSLVIAGVAVVAIAIASTFTFLPALLSILNESVFWPFRPSVKQSENKDNTGVWFHWAKFVMRHPWYSFIPSFILISLLAIPAFYLTPWNPGAKDLSPELEARQGADALAKNFSKGWLGPIVLVLEGNHPGALWEVGSQYAVLNISDQLSKDPRIEHVIGFPDVLNSLGLMRVRIKTIENLTDKAQSAALDVVNLSGNMALITLIPRGPPEDSEVMSLVRELRLNQWPDATKAGLTVKIASASASILDFDSELFGSLWHVIPTVLTVTFFMLLILFRSLLIPLKAIVLNLLSVLAAWGFLVLVFQFGFGAEILGVEILGGLNSFIVIVLFTILFGLSMDYEVLLLTLIQDERLRGFDNSTAVARGLQNAAGTITSAALIMILIFGAFIFTTLTATKQFGLGLVFSVALEATVIRIVLVPVLMQIMGEWNWWAPTWLTNLLPDHEGKKHG